MKTLKNKEELKQYYGKELNYIETTFKDGVLKNNVKKVTVYDPYDYNKRIKPGEGSDICIDGYSTNSFYIFEEENKIVNNTGLFALERYNKINIFTYCNNDNVNKVINLHNNAIKSNVTELKEKLKDRLKELENYNI